MHNYTVPEKKYTLEWRTFRTPKTRSIRWRLCTTASVGSRILLVRSWIYCYSKGACLGIPLGNSFYKHHKKSETVVAFAFSLSWRCIYNYGIYNYIYIYALCCECFLISPAYPLLNETSGDTGEQNPVCTPLHSPTPVLLDLRVTCWFLSVAVAPGRQEALLCTVLKPRVLLMDT